MARLKELKRIFLEVREKLVAESHKLMSELKTNFNSDYEGAIDTVQRMLQVFEGLKILSAHSESFLGALEAEGRVAEAKIKLKAHLEEFVIPVEALKRHRENLKYANLPVLRDVLERESGRDGLDISIPEDLDPVIVSLSDIFPDIFSRLMSDSPRPLPVPEPSGADTGLSEDKAALVKALMVEDDDDDEPAPLSDTPIDSPLADLPGLDSTIAELTSTIAGVEQEASITTKPSSQSVEESVVEESVAEESVEPFVSVESSAVEEASIAVDTPVVEESEDEPELVIDDEAPVNESLTEDDVVFSDDDSVDDDMVPGDDIDEDDDFSVDEEKTAAEATEDLFGELFAESSGLLDADGNTTDESAESDTPAQKE